VNGGGPRPGTDTRARALTRCTGAGSEAGLPAQRLPWRRTGRVPGTTGRSRTTGCFKDLEVAAESGPAT
jgi:hypothetical protein